MLCTICAGGWIIANANTAYLHVGVKMNSEGKLVPAGAKVGSVHRQNVHIQST